MRSLRVVNDFYEITGSATCIVDIAETSIRSFSLDQPNQRVPASYLSGGLISSIAGNQGSDCICVVMSGGCRRPYVETKLLIRL